MKKNIQKVNVTFIGTDNDYELFSACLCKQNRICFTVTK